MQIWQGSFHKELEIFEALQDLWINQGRCASRIDSQGSEDMNITASALNRRIQGFEAEIG